MERPRRGRRLDGIGSWLARAANAAAAGLWAVFVWLDPPYGQAAGAGPTAVAAVMVSLAVLGALAGWYRSIAALLVVFVLSFLPIGLYLLGTPGVFRWIGVCNLLALVGAMMLLVARHRRTLGAAGCQPIA